MTNNTVEMTRALNRHLQHINQHEILRTYELYKLDILLHLYILWVYFAFKNLSSTKRFITENVDMKIHPVKNHPERSLDKGFTRLKTKLLYFNEFDFRLANSDETLFLRSD